MLARGRYRTPSQEKTWAPPIEEARRVVLIVGRWLRFCEWLDADYARSYPHLASLEGEQLSALWWVGALPTWLRRQLFLCGEPGPDSRIALAVRDIASVGHKAVRQPYR